MSSNPEVEKAREFKKHQIPSDYVYASWLPKRSDRSSSITRSYEQFKTKGRTTWPRDIKHKIYDLFLKIQPKIFGLFLEKFSLKISIFFGKIQPKILDLFLEKFSIKFTISFWKNSA